MIPYLIYCRTVPHVSHSHDDKVLRYRNRSSWGPGKSSEKRQVRRFLSWDYCHNGWSRTPMSFTQVFKITICKVTGNNKTQINVVVQKVHLWNVNEGIKPKNLKHPRNTLNQTIRVNVLSYCSYRESHKDSQCKHHSTTNLRHPTASQPEANGPSQMRAHPHEIKHQMRSASHCLNVLPAPCHWPPHTHTHTHTHTHKQSPGGVEWMVHFEIHQERERLWGSYYLTSILKSLKRQIL